MFGLFDSVEKQMRKSAEGWLELADKVYAYRRDQLKEPDRLALLQKTEALKAQLKARDDASKLKLGVEALEEVLRRTGGKFYPRSTLQEYVEFFVVAAIVILGMRAYYVQPFKIPTNSMWPTYYGMTPEVYRTPEEVPGALSRLGRMVMFGAQHQEVTAPASGPVEIKMVVTSGGLSFARNARQTKTWYVFPSAGMEYHFRVDGVETSLVVPADYSIETTLTEAFDLTPQKLQAAVQASWDGKSREAWVNLGKMATAGKPLLSFDIMTGDALFVERLSYHFFKPEVGSGFVFRTGNIPGIGSDQYYIKRLVGTPGDVLEVKSPVLYRNGSPITGAKAFELNANKVGLYRGYGTALGPTWPYLQKGDTVTVPEKGYFAMGDNSYNSSDSRAWGFVPYKDVVGRPLFVYYPFTKRFGIPR